MMNLFFYLFNCPPARPPVRSSNGSQNKRIWSLPQKAKKALLNSSSSSASSSREWGEESLLVLSTAFLWLPDDYMRQWVAYCCVRARVARKQLPLDSDSPLFNWQMNTLHTYKLQLLLLFCCTVQYLWGLPIDETLLLPERHCRCSIRTQSERQYLFFVVVVGGLDWIIEKKRKRHLQCNAMQCNNVRGYCPCTDGIKIIKPLEAHFFFFFLLVVHLFAALLSSCIS